MRLADRVQERRVLAPDLVGLRCGCVGEEDIAQEQVAGSAAAQRVAEEPDLIIKVGQGAAEQGEHTTARTHVSLAEKRVLRQVVEVAVQGEDLLDGAPGVPDLADDLGDGDDARLAKSEVAEEPLQRS